MLWIKEVMKIIIYLLLISMEKIQKELTPFDGVKVSILNGLKEDKDHMIISMNKNNPQINEPYKINIITGELEQLYKNEDAANPINGYEFDKDGKLRGFAKLRDGVNIDLYYTTDGENYEIKKQLNWKDNFSISSFNYATDILMMLMLFQI